MTLIFRSIILLGILSAGAWGRTYEPEDWVNYRDFRYVHSGDIGRDHVYFATTGGITRYDLWQNKWETPLTVALVTGESVVFKETWVVAYDQEKHWLWCGTDEGLFSYNTLSGYWDRYNLPTGNTKIFSIAIQGETVWLEGGNPKQNWRTLFKGTTNFGSFMTATPSELAAAGPVAWRGERQPAPSELPQYFVNAGRMVFSSEGHLSDMNWKDYPVTVNIGDGLRRETYLGFWGYGVGMVDDNTSRMDLIRSGPGNTSIKKILKSEGITYTVGNSFSLWDQNRDLWEYYFTDEYTGFESNECSDLYRQDRTVYLATRQGLAIFNEKTGRFHNLTSLDNLRDSHVTAVDASAGNLWIGTAQGMSVMQVSTELVSRIEDGGVKNQYVNDILADGNYVWAGTEFGLYLHDIEAGDWTYVRGSEEMQNSQVRQIAKNGHEIWFARELGIEYFDLKTGNFTAFNSVFFGNHQALSILPGDSLVWVGTNHGLYKFERRINRWAGFTKEDGLPSNQINSIYRDGDYLWLGTEGGLCRFYWNDPYRLD